MSGRHKECRENTAETQSVIKGKGTTSKQEVGSGNCPHPRGCGFVTVCWRSMSGQPQAVASTGAQVEIRGTLHSCCLPGPTAHAQHCFQPILMSFLICKRVAFIDF